MFLPPSAGTVQPPREELEAAAMGTNMSITEAPEQQTKTIDSNHATQADRSNHHGYEQKREDSTTAASTLKIDVADSHMCLDWKIGLD